MFRFQAATKIGVATELVSNDAGPWVEAMLSARSVAGQSAASSMTARGVAAVMAGVGLNLTDFGLTLTSVVDALVTGGGDPAAIKAGIFHLFYR